MSATRLFAHVADLEATMQEGTRAAETAAASASATDSDQGGDAIMQQVTPASTTQQAKTAAEADARRDYVAEHCLDCPKCFRQIEKTGGCDHMTCYHPGCRFHFCWRCMGEWKDYRHKCPDMQGREEPQMPAADEVGRTAATMPPPPLPATEVETRVIVLGNINDRPGAGAGAGAGAPQESSEGGRQHLQWILVLAERRSVQKFQATDAKQLYVRRQRILCSASRLCALHALLPGQQHIRGGGAILQVSARIPRLFPARYERGGVVRADRASQWTALHAVLWRQQAMGELGRQSCASSASGRLPDWKSWHDTATLGAESHHSH
ncbi:RING-type domain-containing protein [Pseudoscourfieldia marina]